jgi:hypothetical protein
MDIAIVKWIAAVVVVRVEITVKGYHKSVLCRKKNHRSIAARDRRQLFERFGKSSLTKFTGKSVMSVGNLPEQAVKPNQPAEFSS